MYTAHTTEKQQQHHQKAKFYSQVNPYKLKSIA